MKKRNNSQKRQLKLSNHSIFDLLNPDVNWKRAYCSYFQAIPSTKSIQGIDQKRVIQWIETELVGRIVQKHSNEHHKGTRTMRYDDINYVLDNRCIIHIEHRSTSVEILFSGNPEEAQVLLDSITKFKQRSLDSYIHVVVSEHHGLALTSLKMKKPKLTLQKNYNDDLVALHENIVYKLRKKDVSGLTLLHGVPGTGKSTYIRFLINCVNKRIIFLPPKLAGNMDDPQITSLLTENPNTVFVIEDAEDLLVSRDSQNNSGISMLLNLTDGLLGASLGIQFICTFNTHLENIDKALLRKGRLTALYEFKPLSTTKSKKLLEELGAINFIVSQPMTLAEIFYAGQQEFAYERKLNTIGFTSNVA